MSTKGSVFSKGGGGTNYEQSVQTAFLTTLMVRGNAPCIPTNEISEIAFQTTNRGYETDDLLVIADSVVGKHRLLIQVKHNLIFSKDNSVFIEVLTGFWKDYNNQAIFDNTKDKLIIIKSGLTQDERNHLKSLFNWANAHSNEIDFIAEVNRIKGKKDRLDIFRVSLEKINNNAPVSDKKLWEFLKCLDILEYDFLNQSSVDETFFLNLIKLSKSADSVLNEKQIWDSIFFLVAKLNKDGGSVSFESIQLNPLYRNFDLKKLNPYFKSVEKLKADGEIVLKSLKNTIGGLHLDRHILTHSIADSINKNPLTIVTGKPGVGKSAEIKDALKKEFPNASIFVFRADQFNEPHIANVFSSQGVNETIQDVFSCISLIPDKIVFIDSLEKLLEADPECAFKQFLALLSEFPNVKVIFSARRYAVDLIIQKYGIDTGKLHIVEIPLLDDNELNIISTKFSQVRNVLKNSNIKSLLQSPKYLDFAILALNKQSDDYTSISLTGFKNKLWKLLVTDSGNRKSGLPAKREDAFMEIAINRAKEMKLFTKPIIGDKEAIDLLESDEIIFQDQENRRYSPSHDILEDWALVKYIASKFEEYPNPKELFTHLGNAPAIRRAFRLWIEDYLVDNKEEVIKLINTSLYDPYIERYWADEILIAVLKSDNCNYFFSVFEQRLLDNDGKLLNRCLHLAKTGCMESYIRGNTSFLVPIGSGWVELLHFIAKSTISLEHLSISICHFLFSWEYKLLLRRSEVLNKEMEDAKIITWRFITKKEEDGKLPSDVSKKLVSLLFNLAEIAKDEITGLIERAQHSEGRRNHWRENSFYDQVINECLSGIGNQALLKELPKLIVQAAWDDWKLAKEEVSDEFESQLPSFMRNQLRDDECWGIEDKFSFMPSGIYKTPFYNLLRLHPSIAIDFILDFINYSVDFYMSANCSYKHKFEQVKITLNDKSIVTQWGAWELWAAYRGGSVTHYAIESLLKSLEKYLLELAATKSETSKKNLKYFFDLILRKSNNVATSSVLASVAIAYPEEVEEAFLPLLTVKEFYSWDLTRAIHETAVTPWRDDHIHIANEETINSNKLPHRRKYQRGLGDFIVEYQFNVRKVNPQIHSIFDKLKEELNSDDILWKKRLGEIDVRNWKVSAIDEDRGGVIIEPNYEEDVFNFLNSGRANFDAQTKSLNYSGIILNAFDGKAVMDFEKWQECFLHYAQSKNRDFLYDRPVSLSVLGLRDFKSDLTEEQKKWCLHTLANTIAKIIKVARSRDYHLDSDYNIQEKSIALSSIHYLIDNITDSKDKKSLLSLMIYVLTAPFADHEVDEVAKYFRTVLFKNHPNEAKKVWLSLIEYAFFRKENPRYKYAQDSDEWDKIEAAFIKKMSAKKKLVLDVTKVNFDSCQSHFLTRAFITAPYYIDDNDFTTFIGHFINLLMNDFELKSGYSHNRRSDERQVNFNDQTDIQQYLAELLLQAQSSLSKQVLDSLLDPLYAIPSIIRNDDRGIHEFCSRIIERIIYLIDTTVASSTNEKQNALLIDNFWRLWEYLFEKIKHSGKPYFISWLFLDIVWKEESKHWRILEGRKDTYHRFVIALGEKETMAMINLFSSAGEQTFLPEGITWLVDIYKTDFTQTLSLASPTTERLIKRLFYNHISKIKIDKTLINDFIWILDRKIDYGSSSAYLFRENVITYKSNG